MLTAQTKRDFNQRKRIAKDFNPSPYVLEQIYEVMDNINLYIDGVFDNTGKVNNCLSLDYRESPHYKYIINEETGELMRVLWRVKSKARTVFPERKDGKWVKKEESSV